MLGVLKAVLGIIIFLLVVLVVLNFVPAFNGVVDTLNDKIGDSRAFHFMFPLYEAREVLEPADVPQATAEPTAEPIVDITDVTSSTVLPDLSEDAAGQSDAGDAGDGASADAAANLG